MPVVFPKAATKRSRGEIKLYSRNVNWIYGVPYYSSFSDVFSFARRYAPCNCRKYGLHQLLGINIAFNPFLCIVSSAIIYFERYYARYQHQITRRGYRWPRCSFKRVSFAHYYIYVLFVTARIRINIIYGDRSLLLHIHPWRGTRHENICGLYDIIDQYFAHWRFQSYGRWYLGNFRNIWIFSFFIWLYGFILFAHFG